MPQVFGNHRILEIAITVSITSRVRYQFRTLQSDITVLEVISLSEWVTTRIAMSFAERCSDMAGPPIFDNLIRPFTV